MFTKIKKFYTLELLEPRIYSKLQPNIKVKFEDWISSMKPDMDNEDGSKFLEWIKNHEKDAELDSALRTFVFLDKRNEEIVATASFVADDQDVGKICGGGPFIGGVNVHRDLRGLNIGTSVMASMDKYIQDYSNKRGESITVKLFTNDPVAIRIYTKFGFEALKCLGSETLYAKKYNSLRFGASALPTVPLTLHDDL